MTSNTLTATILLVDDEPSVTNALGRHFDRRRHVVLQAASAAEAFKLLERNTVDVVVSDEQMPDLPGSRFLSMVRQQYPDTIRMILSGQATIDAAVRAINEGEVYRFFLKPCNPIDLVSTIDKAIEHKRLEVRSRELLREYRRQGAILEAVQQRSPELLGLNVDEMGAILVDAEDASCDIGDLLRQMEESMAVQRQRLAPT
jgi:DNA-binding NtrC family response regulator